MAVVGMTVDQVEIVVSVVAEGANSFNSDTTSGFQKATLSPPKYMFYIWN